MFNPWITCTIEPHQRPSKEKRPHLKSCACLGHHSWNAWRSCLSVTCWSSIQKRVVVAAFSRLLWKCSHSEKGKSQAQREVVQHSLDRQSETWKVNSCFTLYLDEFLIQKCKFGGRFKVSSLYLERYSPRGSCHLDESSMNHTLPQKRLIELSMWNASHVQKHFS